MRFISDTPSKLEFPDVLNDNSKIGFYYRLPTTIERSQFARDSAGKQEAELWLQCHKYGKMVITGLTDGSFGDDDGPISSDPKSPDYREDWRDLILESDICSEEVQATAKHIFLGLTLRQWSEQRQAAAEAALRAGAKLAAAVKPKA